MSVPPMEFPQGDGGPPQQSAPIWSLRNVTFNYPGAPNPSVNDVSLDIPGGRLTALLGPNGAGKSTLLQLLLGTLVPANGAIAFSDRPLSSFARKELARTIGVVPQGESEPIFGVREIVAMGRYPHLGPWQREGNDDREAVAEAMARCDVTQFADRWFATLSGGERQRVRVARALAQRPSVLVLDEPTNSLDVRHEMTTFELLRELRVGGTTVVLATHNLNMAARYADEIVLMHHGRVAAPGCGERRHHRGNDRACLRVARRDCAAFERSAAGCPARRVRDGPVMRARLKSMACAIAFAVAGAFALVPIPAEAQVQGMVEGRVTDARTGQPIPNARVEIAGRSDAAVTEIDGAFVLRGLEPRAYTLRARAVGYAAHETDIEVVNTRAIEVNITLEPLPPQLESVVVSARARDHQRVECRHVRPAG